MSKLQELLDTLCPNGVETYKLGDIVEILDHLRKPVTKKNRTEGIYPYYGANGIQDYVGEYIFDGVFLLVGEDGSVITKESTPVLTWAEGKIWVNNHAHILKENGTVTLRYLYHYLQTVNVSSVVRGTPPKLNQENLKNINISVPPLEVQSEIVRILDNFTELKTRLITELETELETRKKQYNYYKNTFFAEYNKTKYKLKDVADIYLGLTYTPRYVDNGIKFISSQNISKDYLDLENNIKYISKEEFENCTNNAKPKKGDVLFTRVGSNLGHPTVVDTDEPLCIFVSLGYLRAKEEYVLGSYLKHWMNSEAFWDQVKKKTKNIPKVNLNSSWMREFDISIPNIEKQRHIVTILDQYDKLRKDLFDELTAEIATQQKQYEYYRDKLLTFEEKV